MAEDPLFIDPDRERRVLREARTRRQQFDTARSQISPQMAQRAIASAQRAPNASPGMHTALALGLINESQFDQLATQEAETDTGWTNSVSSLVGGVVGGAADLVTDVLSHGYEQVIKPTLRGAVTVLDTAAEEIVQRPFTAALATAQTHGAVSFSDAYQGYGNSEGVIAARNLLDSDPETGLDLGQGFFPGGQIGAESQAQKTMTIQGEPLTLSSALSNGLLGRWQSPGDKAYDLVGGIGQFAFDVLADPVAIATGGATAALKSRRLLDVGEATRMLDDAGRLTDDGLRHIGAVGTTTRNTALAERATQFFRDPDLLQSLARSDAHDIYRSWKKSPANRIDLETIGRLGRATDEDEIAEILLSKVADGHINTRGFYGGIGSQVRNKVANFRFAGVAPKGLLDADDLDDAAEKLDSFMRQGNVDEDVLDDLGNVVGGRRQIFNRLADLQPGDTAGLYQVATDAMSEVARTVKDINPTLAADDVRKMTRIFDNEVSAFRRYASDELADPIHVPFPAKHTNPDGTEFIVPTPTISSELNKAQLPLPDVQDIRRAATESSVLRSVYQTAGWDKIEGGMRRITQRYFKPLAIFRPAYVTRIVGLDEQFRLMASGYDSLWSHPVRFLSANVLNRKAMTDLVGDDLTAKARAMNLIHRDAAGILGDATKGQAKVWDDLPKILDDAGAPQEDFVTAWRHELGQLAAAPEVRAMARSRGNLDEFVDWARNTDEGREVVGRMAMTTRGMKAIATDDTALREWGEQTIWRRVTAKTGGDADLLDGIADLRFGGFDLSDPLDDAKVNRFLRSKIDTAPDYVKVEKNLSGVASKAYDSVMNTLGDWITGKPTAYFSRIPAWRQQIVRNVGDMMPSMADDAMREDIIRKLDDALQLTKKERKAIASAAVKAKNAKGVLTSVDQVNEIALGRAADHVKDLMFDVSRTSATQDTLVTMVPFYDAFIEVSKNWAGLAAQNPAFFMRAQAGYTSMQDSGLFTVNDFGDQVFSYPGGGALASFLQRLNASGGDLIDVPGAAAGAIADAVTGNTPDAQVPLEGRVQGLNLVTQGVGPGFGPVVQWAAGAFLPDSPDHDRLREWISPFGNEVRSAGDLLSVGALAESLTPAWADKMINAWTGGKPDPIQWNSTVGDVQKVLASTGDYDPENPQDAQRLMKDAERGGAWILFLRGLVQGVGPTGPQATWKINTEGVQNTGDPKWEPETDPDGHWHTLNVMQSEYRRMFETYGDHELATAQFVSLYGIEPYYVTQAKTQEIRNLPVDEQGDTWIRKHRDLVDDYPTTIGYFSPAGEGGEFDYGIYAQQIERGDRQSLTPKQQLELANQTKARAIYSNVRRRVENAPSKAKRRVLDMTKAWLNEEFVGWQFGVLGVEQAANQERRIAELEQAVADPRLADSALRDPLMVYLAARRGMEAEAERRGFKTLGGQSVADLRERLTILGDELAVRSSPFAGVWKRVLSNEVST